MTSTNYQILEHPRIYFYLLFFCYAIGIACSSISTYPISIALSLVLPLIIILIGWWRRWYTIVLAILVSGFGWYMWHDSSTKRETAYTVIQTETQGYSGSYHIQWTVEKLLYNSDLTHTYRLHIDSIDNRSTIESKPLRSLDMGIFVEIPNNLHINIGDTIAYTGKMYNVINFPLSGFAGYAWYNEIYGKSRVPVFQRIHQIHPSRLEKIQIWAKSVLFAGFPENIAGIILGMTIGNIELLTNETKKYFTNAGITHILVVSGSNIAFVIVILSTILRYIPVPQILRTCVVLVFVFWYGSLVGWDAPVLRAVAMGIITYIVLVWWKKVVSVPLLCMVGWGILLYSPLALLYDAGFGLSFMGTLGILLLHPPIQSLLTSRYIPWWIRDILSITIAASIGSSIAILYFFHTIPVFSLISNILISWFLGWILFASMVYLFFAFMGWWILYVWGWTIYIPTAYILWIGHIFWNGYIITLDSMIAEILAIFMMGLFVSVIFVFEKNCLLQTK